MPAETALLVLTVCRYLTVFLKVKIELRIQIIQIKKHIHVIGWLKTVILLTENYTDSAV